MQDSLRLFAVAFRDVSPYLQNVVIQLARIDIEDVSGADIQDISQPSQPFIGKRPFSIFQKADDAFCGVELLSKVILAHASELAPLAKVIFRCVGHGYLYTCVKMQTLSLALTKALDGKVSAALTGDMLTPTQLATASGISVPYAWQILNGKRSPSLAVALRIYDATSEQLGPLDGLGKRDIEAARKMVGEA